MAGRARRAEEDRRCRYVLPFDAKILDRSKSIRRFVLGQDFSTMVRNVIEYLGDSTAGMLCSQTCREAPDIM